MLLYRPLPLGQLPVILAHDGLRLAVGHCKCVNANLKLSIFAETKCHFSAVGIVVYTALFHNFTCRHEACQALIYQPVLGLTGENGKYNYSKAVHVYPPFSDITCSAKNYKIALALTARKATGLGQSYQKFFNLSSCLIFSLKTLVQFATGYPCCISPSEIRELSHEVILDISKSVVTVSSVGDKTPKQATPLKHDVIWQKEQIF